MAEKKEKDDKVTWKGGLVLAGCVLLIGYMIFNVYVTATQETEFFAGWECVQDENVFVVTNNMLSGSIDLNLGGRETRCRKWIYIKERREGMEGGE